MIICSYQPFRYEYNLHCMVHLSMQSQGTDEQREKWLPLAKSYSILGAFAQTELGHG